MATVDATEASMIRIVTMASRVDEGTTEIKIAMEINTEIAGEKAAIDTIITVETVAEEVTEVAMIRSDEQARACRSYRLKVRTFFCGLLNCSFFCKICRKGRWSTKA